MLVVEVVPLGRSQPHKRQQVAVAAHADDDEARAQPPLEHVSREKTRAQFVGKAELQL